MSLAFFFINIFNILSGTFNSVDSMPNWVLKHWCSFSTQSFYKYYANGIFKGKGLSDISYHLTALFIIGFILNVWAILNYRKTILK